MAKNVVGTLLIEMSANVARLQQDVDKAKNVIEAFATRVKAVLGPIGAVLAFSTVFNDISKFIKKSVDEAAEAEKVFGRLNAALSAHGVTVKDAAQAYANIAKELQSKTIFDDETIMKAMALGTTMGVMPSQIRPATEAALSLAQAFDMDVNNAMQMVAQALEGNYRGLRTLIPAFGSVEKGAMSAAQVLDLISQYVGNAAQREVTTYAGMVKQLNNEWKDLAEDVGMLLIPTLKGLVSVVRDLIHDFKSLFGINDANWARREAQKWQERINKGREDLEKTTDPNQREKILQGIAAATLKRDSLLKPLEEQGKKDQEILNKADKQFKKTSPDWDRAKNEAWEKILIKLHSEQQKVIAGTDDWRKKVIDVNAEFDTLLKQYPKHTAEIEKHRKLKLDQLEFEREIYYINQEYKENLAKENAELERSANLNKAKLDAEYKIASAQLSLRSSRGENVEILKLELDYNKEVSDIKKQIEDIEAKKSNASGDVLLNLQSQKDVLQMMLPAIKEVYETSRKITEENELKKKDPYAGAMEGIRKLEEQYTSFGKTVENITVNTFKNMEDALVEFTTTGKFNFRSFAEAFVSDINRMIIQMLIMKPILDSLKSSLGGSSTSGGSNVFGGIFSKLGEMFSGFFGPDVGFGVAKGGVFEHGIRKFARGGIIYTPTFFPMANGGVGLMGEAGPEAIMPLTKTPDGRLGVASSGGGEQAPSILNINIHAVDAKSFDELCKKNPQAILGPLEKALNSNYSIRNSIRSNMR